MNEWRTIKRNIMNAMNHVESEVYYEGPNGGQCSVFTVKVYDEDYEGDDFYDDLADVCKEWGLLQTDWYLDDDNNLCMDLHAD